MTGSCITVGICGANSSVFKRLSDELLEAGYCLYFYPTLAEVNAALLKLDIYIVDVSKAYGLSGPIHSKLTPYLVAGIGDFLTAGIPEDILKNSVGFIQETPSLVDTCISIKLGLLLSQERQQYALRVQNIETKIMNNRVTGVAIGMLMNKTGLTADDVLACLKSESRAKQRRMVDVAEEINNKQALLNSDDLSSKDALSLWLKVTVEHRDNAGSS